MTGPHPNPHVQRDTFRARLVVFGLVIAVPITHALASGPDVSSPIAAHAPDLVGHVRRLIVAVIHGDLPAAHEASRWVAENAEPSALSVPAHPSLSRVKEAATALATAPDVARAAAVTGELVASCGGCHDASGITPPFPRPAPPAFGSIAGHMVRHQNSADLLLEGLVVPSTAAWMRGTGQLREDPLKPGDFPVSDRIGALMAEVEMRLHAQAAEAGKARDTPSRARAFGVMLATCAECHTKHTTLWPQGNPR